MSLTDKLDPRSAIDSPRSCGKSQPTQKLLALAAVAMALAFLFVAGHPVVAIWAALLLVGWLFLAGAAQASEDGAGEPIVRPRNPR